MTRNQEAFMWSTNSFLADLFILVVGLTALGLMLWLWPVKQAAVVAAPVVSGHVFLLTPTGPAPSPLSDFVGEPHPEASTAAWVDSKGTAYSTRAAVLFVAKKGTK